MFAKILPSPCWDSFPRVSSAQSTECFTHQLEHVAAIVPKPLLSVLRTDYISLYPDGSLIYPRRILFAAYARVSRGLGGRDAGAGKNFPANGQDEFAGEQVGEPRTVLASAPRPPPQPPPLIVGWIGTCYALT